MRACAVDALCCAVVDTHSSVAPSSVLLHVLQNVLLDSVKVLEHEMVTRVADGTWVSNRIAEDKRINEPYDIGISSTALSAIRNNTETDIVLLLRTLCKVSIANINRIGTLKNFGGFWKDLLASITFFLDAPPPIGAGYDSVLDEKCVDLVSTVDECRNILKALLNGASNSALFVNGNEPSSLWIITKQAVGNLKKYPNLLTDLVDSISR